MAQSTQPPACERLLRSAGRNAHVAVSTEVVTYTPSAVRTVMDARHINKPPAFPLHTLQAVHKSQTRRLPASDI